jgi:hypothetical protein
MADSDQLTAFTLQKAPVDNARKQKTHSSHKAQEPKAQEPKAQEPKAQEPKAQEPKAKS